MIHDVEKCRGITFKAKNEMKKVYIAGAVTGLDYNEVVKKFNEAEERLLDQRYIVINPVKIVPPGTDWDKSIRICIKALMGCDAIALLPGFSNSKGALLEYNIAKELDFTKIFL